MSISTKKMKFGDRAVTLAKIEGHERWALIYTEKVDEDIVWCVTYLRHEPKPGDKKREYFDIDSKKFCSVATDHESEKEAKLAAQKWLKDEALPEVDPPIKPQEVV